MAKNKINNLIWLVDTINRHGKISFAEINEKWLAGDKERKEIPLRTFHNHRRDIEDMFDINIECDKSTNSYYIDCDEGLLGSRLKMWLLNSFSMNNILNESVGLKQRILFEDIPSGIEYIEPITEAMRKGVQITVKYQPYYAAEPNEIQIEPYFLRLFRQRWYLIGESNEKRDLRTYALDRMQGVEITDKRFSYPGSFSPKEYFRDSYGIIKENDLKAMRTIIKATAYQSHYLRNLPLHESQREIERNAEYSLFELTLCPTFDLCQQLLSYGETIEVLEPTELREMMREKVGKMGEIYAESKRHPSKRL